MRKSFDLDKIQVVDIDQVIENTWNPKGKKGDVYAELKAGIRKRGLRAALPVREFEGKYQLIDGEQRFNIAKELGYKTIWIYNEGEIEDAEAIEMTLWYQKQVPFELDRFGKLVNEFPDITMPFLDKEKLPVPNKGNIETVKMESEFVTLSIPMQRTQKAVIEQAIKKVQDAEGNVGNARALEFICIEYINMPKGQ